jgi:hypothetical protein
MRRNRKAAPSTIFVADLMKTFSCPFSWDRLCELNWSPRAKPPWN